MDGNFSAEQLKMKNPEDDVFLADGHGYFTSKDLYRSHLQVVKEVKEVSKVCVFWTSEGLTG